MKALRKTVASLLATIDGEIEEMKVEVVPASRTYGLASLPDEMLLRILNFVVASYEWTDLWSIVRKELLRVTQVSQRFRRCASAAQGIHEYGRFNEKPKRDFYFYGNPDEIGHLRIPYETTTKLSVMDREFHPLTVATLLTNMPSLKYLDINLIVQKVSLDEFDPDDFHGLLPQLEYLRVSNSWNPWEISDRWYTPLGHVFRGLSMPRLWEVQLCGNFEDIGWNDQNLDELLDDLLDIKHKSYGGVTRFVFLGLYCDMDSDMPTMYLNTFHRKFPDVEELHLHCNTHAFSIDERGYADMGGDDSEPAINLAPLKRLRISFEYPPNDTERPSLLLEEMRKFGAVLEEVVIDRADDSVIQDARSVFPRAHRVTSTSLCEY